MTQTAIPSSNHGRRSAVPPYVQSAFTIGVLLSIALTWTAFADENTTTVDKGVLRVNDDGVGSVVVTNSSSTIAGTLCGSGTVRGDVNVNSSSAKATARIYPDGPVPPRVRNVLSISGNLTLGLHSLAAFNVSGDREQCDQIKLTGEKSVLNCDGAQVALQMAGSGCEVPLITLSGGSASIVGSFDPKPLWLGTPPLSAANYQIVTEKTRVILRYNLPHIALIPKSIAGWPRLYCGPEDKDQIKKQIALAQATLNVSESLTDWAFDNKDHWAANSSAFWKSIHAQYDAKDFVSGRRLAEQLQAFNIVMAYGMTSDADYLWLQEKVAKYVNRELPHYPDTLSRKYGMGNGDIEQYYPMLQAAVLFPNHPDAQMWLDRSVDWISQCVRGYWIDGVGLESSRYYGTVLAELSCCLPTIERCTGINLYASPELRAGLEWWIRYISPPVVPHEFPYTLPPWGDADVAASFDTHLAYVRAYNTLDPDFSRRLAGWWLKSGGKVPGGWMNPVIAPQISDPSLPGNPLTPSAPPTSTYSPTFGQVTMRSESGDAGELYLTMKCGKGPNGHCHGDQGSIELYAFGRMLLTESYCGPYGYGMDWARASRAHNTVVYENKDVDGTADAQFQAFGSSSVADYCTVSWREGTARHVVMVKPDYVVIWDQAAAGTFADYWMHADARKLTWDAHKVGVETRQGDVDVDVHFLLPSYPLPAPNVRAEPQTKNETTANWMASDFLEPVAAGPYTREGLGLQAWSMPPIAPPEDPKSKYIKYFSVRSATPGGHFLTILHPRKVGITPQIYAELINASGKEVSLRINLGGRTDIIKIDNQGASITRGSEPALQFARTFPVSGVAGPARLVLCQDGAVLRLDKPSPTTGAVEACIGTIVLGADQVLPNGAPLIARPCGVFDLNGHRSDVSKLIMDCGTITGPGTLTCGDVDWYGGKVSPNATIVCKGTFRKYSGAMTALPPNITCASGITFIPGADK